MSNLEKFYNEHFYALGGYPKFEELTDDQKKEIEQTLSFALYRNNQALQALLNPIFESFTKFINKIIGFLCL